DSNTIINKYAQNSIERKIISILASSSEVYRYDSENQLDFELKLRKSIINAARELNRSYFSFRVFRKSICNLDYWNKTDEGGFALKNGIKPSEAIKDIYIHSSKYGTECSTAMVIVYYRALVDIFPEDLFNKLFSQIYLMNWQHLDRDLGIADYMNPADYIPGDCLYFRNPEVDPLNPEWQGENAIYLDEGSYYGHGIGIANAEKVIEVLNKKRISGATVSAYLVNSAKRLNFKYLSYRFYSFVPRSQKYQIPIEVSKTQLSV
ncbi:MAG: protein-glutamine gamma-glutamyltransferase, partial [Ruminiclostridium sp.]